MTRVLGMCDVALAEKRQQMMLAQAVEVDIPDDDHLVIINCEQRAVENVLDVRLVPARQELEGLLNPFRRVAQSFTARILPELGQQPFD
jgi:hypothetical protein